MILACTQRLPSPRGDGFNGATSHAYFYHPYAHHNPPTSKAHKSLGGDLLDLFQLHANQVARERKEFPLGVEQPHLFLPARECRSELALPVDNFPNRKNEGSRTMAAAHIH